MDRKQIREQSKTQISTSEQFKAELQALLTKYKATPEHLISRLHELIPPDQRYNKFDGLKKKMLIALDSCRGNVTNASVACGVDRSTHYTWITSGHESYDAEYLKAYKQIKESRIDFVESQLDKLIDNLEPSSIYFYLKTQAKKRGYVEKSILGFDETPGDEDEITSTLHI